MKEQKLKQDDERKKERPILIPEQLISKKSRHLEGLGGWVAREKSPQSVSGRPIYFYDDTSSIILLLNHKSVLFSTLKIVLLIYLFYKIRQRCACSVQHCGTSDNTIMRGIGPKMGAKWIIMALLCIISHTIPMQYHRTDPMVSSWITFALASPCWMIPGTFSCFMVAFEKGECVPGMYTE